MSGSPLEVNKLTYKIYKYLSKKGWKMVGNDDRFIRLQPSALLKTDIKSIVLPIENNGTDFYRLIKEVIALVQTIYKNDDFSSLIDLNEKLKYRFTKNWIQPEEESKIAKIHKNDVYIPNHLRN